MKTNLLCKIFSIIHAVIYLTTSVDDLSDLDEFAAQPWTSDQVSGQIVFEALQQSAGRRAILRDREAFPVFLDTIRSVEPGVNKAIERVTKEIDAQTADRLADTLRRVFGLVLKELADLDNPMRTALGNDPGEGALFVGDGGVDVDAEAPLSSPGDRGAQGATPSIDELVDAARDPIPADSAGAEHAVVHHEVTKGLQGAARHQRPTAQECSAGKHEAWAIAI
jgi:hypothetical protein